ncbi:hypothetical protein LG634_27010 [Streptomyces bambusae]|uniref:phage baseplate protein n=1 Tax=Streptomyces bambusae TaxID=1550616 RepID=UPI001CFEDDFF|nr:hypothetical protein [Streptomyces bambusae]MCB5168460.1 hypothetical protein [Streptomyces bambusae]
MAVAVDGQIDIAGPVGKLLHRRPLQNTTVMQSFGIDPVTGEVFVLQVVEGGLRLAGESTAPTGAQRRYAGDLCVTRLSAAGAITGHMYLRGFGHGVSMGVEHHDGVSRLWTETDSLPMGSGVPEEEKEGYGTAVTHFEFRNGTVVDRGSALLAAPYRPVAGATNVTCTIDPTTNRVIVRFKSGSMTFESYDLDRARAGDWVPLARITQPDAHGVFQGYASLGGVLYMLAGQAYSATVAPPGNTWLTAVDWATGAVLDQQFVSAAPGLELREPEGMAVSVRSGVPHVHFGFAGEEPGPRTCTVLSLSGAPEVDGVKVLADWQPIPLASGVAADVRAPQGRLVSIAGTTVLQLSGGVKGTFDSDVRLGTLPDALAPSMAAQGSVPRNNSAGVCTARAEANSARELWLYGGRTTNPVTWAQLDNFSVVWR